MINRINILKNQFNLVNMGHDDTIVVLWQRYEMSVLSLDETVVGDPKEELLKLFHEYKPTAYGLAAKIVIRGKGTYTYFYTETNEGTVEESVVQEGRQMKDTSVLKKALPIVHFWEVK